MIKILCSEDPGYAAIVGDSGSAGFRGIILDGGKVRCLYNHIDELDPDYEWDVERYWKAFPEEYEYIKKHYPEALI